MTNFFKLLLILSFVFSQNSSGQSHNANKILDSLKTNHILPKDQINLLENNIEDFSDPVSKIEAYIILAESYSEIEVYDLSYKYNSIAVKIADSIKHHEKLGYLYKNLGKIQLRLGNYESSLDFHKKSQEFYKLSGNTKWQLIAKGNIAIIQSKIGPVEEAITILKELINHKDFNQQNKATTLMTLGNIYLTNLEIPHEAIKLYQEALDLLHNQPDDILIIMLHQNIAESYIELKKYTEALMHNNISAEILKTTPNLEFQATLHLFYAQIYAAKGMHSKAYDNITKSYKYKDSLSKNTTQLKIANIETAREIEIQKNNTALQANKIESLEREKYIDNLKTSILLISIALLICIAYLIIKRAKGRIKTLKTEKSSIEDKLDFNKSKAEEMALNITTSQEYVATFVEKIKNVSTKVNDKKSKDELNKLLREIQSYKIINDHKKNFNSYLDKVGNDYVYQLTQKFPELTKEDRKLCILIHLNLKNKEIASLLNLSVRSIENKRYRIRKKMNLETSENLADILSNL